MRPPHVVRSQPCRHRLDTLALAPQQQALAIVSQRRVPVRIFRSFRQALHVGRKTLLLPSWPGEFGARKTILRQIVLLYHSSEHDLRRFNENAHLDRKANPLRARVLILAEMTLDVFENVLTQVTEHSDKVPVINTKVT